MSEYRCPRCWEDAYLRHLATGDSQRDAYAYIAAVRQFDADEVIKCAESVTGVQP